MVIENKNILIPKLRFKEFKSEWKRKKLCEVAKVITGSTPSTANREYYDGEKLFVSPADIQGNRYVYKTKTSLTDLGFSKGRKVKKGSVLFVCIGSTIGKVAQTNEDSITNQQINALENKEDYSNDFIYSLLDLKGKKIKLLAGVQAVPQINKTDFSNLKYSFPTLQEQQKIAAFLTAVDDKIQQLTKKKTLLEQYKKGVMQQIFSQQLRFKTDDGSSFPDWEDKKLGVLVKIKSGSSPSNYIFEKEGEFPFLKVEELNNSIKYQSKSRFYSNNDKGLIEKNSIIFPKRGAAIMTNKVRVNSIPVIMDSNLMAIIPIKNLLNSEFIYYYILKEKLYKIADTSTIPQINNKHIEPYKINLPSLKEQQKIATYLSAIDTKIESLQTQIAKTQTFKKGLLQQLFV